MWIAVLGLLFACGDGAEEEDTAPPEPVSVVGVVQAALGSVAERITTTSSIEAERSADIVPISPGVVLSIHKDDGDSVKKGELLAVLENVSLSAGAERGRAEVSRLAKQVEEKRALFKRGAISQRELDDLTYQLQSARTNSREASRSYGQTRLTAPFDGVVARRDVKVGELSNQRAFQIVDLSVLKVIVDLPERDVGRVKGGQPVLLESAYDTEVQGTGTVARVSPVIDSMTGTFRVTVDVDDGQSLRPGQFVNVRIEVDRHNDVLVVPRKALLWEDGKAVVYTMIVPPPPEESDDEDEEEDKKEEEPEEPDPDARVAARTPIQTGLIDDKSVEILEGLEAGAEVIVVGQSNLKDGARVRAADAKVEMKTVPKEDAG